MDESLKFDLQSLRHEVEEAASQASRYINTVNVDSSPACLRDQLCDAAVVSRLMKILQLLLSCAISQQEGLMEFEFPYLGYELAKVSLSLQALRAEGYQYLMGNLQRTEFKKCMVYRVYSERQYVKHPGTGREQYRGSSSGTDGCDGPLRTEEEIRLGMCGSCLNKYGPNIGTPILSQEALQRLKEKEIKVNMTAGQMKAAALKTGVE